jgi:tetratricopeptide (TPR) repeat protein
MARRALWVVVALAVLGAIAWAGPKAIRRWQFRRYLEQAQEFKAKSDLRNASLCLRKAILKDVNSVEAARLMAELLASANSPAAVSWREKVAELEPNQAQNWLDLAQAALQQGDLNTAKRALETVGPDGRNRAAFPKLSGILAQGQGDSQEAEKQLEEALRREPANAVTRHNLAVIRLQSTNVAVASEARHSLLQLSSNPVVQVPALRDLTADALARKRFTDAVALSSRLQQSTQATFSDRILHLSVLGTARDPGLDSALEQTQAESTNSPQRVFELGRWMLGAGRAQQAIGWIQDLPPRLQTNQPVPLILVACRAALQDWDGLAALLDEQSWGELEFYRWALRAKVHRAKDERAAARASWLKALRLAGGQRERLGQLAQATAEWGWEPEREEVLSTMIERNGRETWAVGELTRLYVNAGRTDALARMLNKAVESSPTNAAVKNNLAIVSLLLDQADAKGYRLAREAYDLRPDDPHTLSTYAFSLSRQHKPAEALDLFGKLKPEQLQDPAVAVYYGIVLAESGRKAEAQKYLAFAEKLKLLPEEARLVSLAKAR